MIKVEVKNGLPHIDGRLCSYETTKIRSMIQEFAEVNNEFILPSKYSFVVTELNGFAKIVKTRNQGQKLPIHNVMPPLNSLDFKKMRKSKGLTLREVEKITGVSNPYLSQLETGKIKSPGYDVVKTLYDLYSNAR